jgi:hypothetical protein
MSIVAVRVSANGKLAAVPPEEIRNGRPVYDHDQHRAVMVADLGYVALIRRTEKGVDSHHWRARALITPAN